MTRIGTVGELRRYPVKSMLGENSCTRGGPDTGFVWR